MREVAVVIGDPDHAVERDAFDDFELSHSNVRVMRCPPTEMTAGDPLIEGHERFARPVRHELPHPDYRIGFARSSLAKHIGVLASGLAAASASVTRTDVSVHARKAFIPASFCPAHAVPTIAPSTVIPPRRMRHRARR
jgi:hypothetical protein